MRMTTSAMLALAALLAGACGDGGGLGDISTPSGATELSVRSPAFEGGGTLPERFTCDGAGDVPALEWDGGPEDTVEYALVVTDPDAPGDAFVHWVIAGIPPAETQVGEGRLPSGATIGSNSEGDEAWFPACPPVGDAPHTYRFTVYALDEQTQLEQGFAAAELQQQAEGSVVGAGSLEASYGR